MLRRCETCAADIDDELLLQLKDWRLRTAKEMNVPAYVVFTDNTLIAIAELLPDRRRRAGRDSRHRCPQARAVRPGRARSGPQPRLMRGSTPNPRSENRLPRPAGTHLASKRTFRTPRRKGGALMITLNAFDVRPAGDAGSRHAAHAAMSAAAHKRTCRRQDPASVDWGSPYVGSPESRQQATDPKSPGSVAIFFWQATPPLVRNPQDARQTRKQVARHVDGYRT